MNGLSRKIKCGVTILVLALLGGCGSAPLATTLLGHGTQSAAATDKVPCDGSHSGFFVCLSSSTQISDADLASTIQAGLTRLATLVNSTAFDTQLNSAFSGDTSVNAALAATNYTVTITGYCDANSDVLANASVGGDQINYNECRVAKNAAGDIDAAAVDGVLLHEISHNIGYTHPAVNPSRRTVPYYLGDLAQLELGGSSAASGNSLTDFADHSASVMVGD